MRLRLRDERGSLPMLILVMIMTVALGGLLVPMLLTHDRTTRFDDSRVRALDAAQAGIDVTLSNIRAAMNTQPSRYTQATYGNSAELPCGPLTGTVDHTGKSSYYVEILYYLSDPMQSPAPTPMTCSPGFGPSGSGQHTPRFACIIASGGYGPLTAPGSPSTGCTGTAVHTARDDAAASGTSAGRTLVTTYVFRTDDASRQLRTVDGCMQVANKMVNIDDCTDPATPVQMFSVRGDGTIRPVTDPSLCIGWDASDPSNKPVTLDVCETPLAENQLWTLNPVGQYFTIGDDQGNALDSQVQKDCTPDDGPHNHLRDHPVCTGRDSQLWEIFDPTSGTPTLQNTYEK